MMSDVRELLDRASRSFYEENKNDPLVDQLFTLGADPIIRGALRSAYAGMSLNGDAEVFKQALMLMPDVARVFGDDASRSVLIGHSIGGTGTTIDSLVQNLFSQAKLRMFFLRLSVEIETFVGLTQDGLSRLLEALAGDEVPVIDLIQFTGIELSSDVSIQTPWGTIRRAPDVEARREDLAQRPLGPLSSVILAHERLEKISFASVDGFERLARDTSVFQFSERVSVLFPLSCALATPSGEPFAPAFGWETILVPFLSLSGWRSGSRSGQGRRGSSVDGVVEKIEEWSRIIDAQHTASIDVSARRAVSAVAIRDDRSDSLIDAVMVWENLVGTSAETTFRVTSALAKLLEPDLEKRLAFRKELKRIYDLRSRVVHGDAVDASKVHASAKEAISVALSALGASYLRGSGWLDLSSEERADTLLLREA